jgi:uncharacterized protein
MLLNRNGAQLSWGYQILALSMCVFLCFAVFGAVVFAIVPLISKMDVTAFFEYSNYADAAHMKKLTLIQSLYTMGAFAMPAVLFAYWMGNGIKNNLGLQQPKDGKQYLFGVLALLAGLGFVALLAKWNLSMPASAAMRAAEDKATELTKGMLNIKTTGQLFVTLFYIALLPAIAEEFLFRAALQNLLMRIFGEHKIWIAVLITAILFGVMHGQMLSLFPRIFMGILLGYLFVYSKSIYVCILAHFFNNGLQVFLSYLHNIGKFDMDINGTPDVAIWQGLLSLALSVACILLVKHLAKPKLQ